MKNFNLFCQDELSENVSHYSILCFLNEWIRICHCHSSDQLEVFRTIDHNLVSLFDIGSSGFGHQSGGTIFNYYDKDWMPDEGIDPFKDGECFVVDFEDTGWLFPSVMYSRSELSGWFSLALERYGDRFPEVKKQIIKIEERYYSPDEVKEELQKKIRAEVEWEYGPCGHLSSEKLALWKKTVCSRAKRGRIDF